MNLVDLVRTAWLALGIYALLGLAFAGHFFAAGLVRLDPAARGAGPGFRLLILPGVLALWPLLASRWWVIAGNPDAPPLPPERPLPPEHLRRGHLFVWTLLTLAGPLVLAVSLIWRPVPRTPSTLPLPLPSSLPASASGSTR